MSEPIIQFFASILLTALLTGFLAWYAWRQPPEPGVRTFALIMLDECLLAGAEAASMLSGSPAQALFWFNLRFLFISILSVLWVVFAIQYVGRSDWLSKRLLIGLCAIPALTQVFLWTNPLHHWWLQQEVAFQPVDGFWLADTTARVPGLWFMVHNFYTTLLTLATMIALLVSIGRKRSIYRGQAILVSLGLLAALTIAQIPIFNIAPQLPYNPFIPGLGLGALFVLAAVLGFRFLGRTPTQEQISRVTRLDAQDKRSLASLVLIFIVFVAGVAAISYFTYRDYAHQFRDHTEDQLSSIASMKVNELVNWRAERLGDAEAAASNPAFTALVQTVTENPQDPEAQAKLQGWLDVVCRAYGYARVLLFADDGQELAASTSVAGPRTVFPVSEMDALSGSQEPVFLDFHRHEAGGPVYMAAIAPVHAPEDPQQFLGYLVLQIDPSVYLYPYIQGWPVPSESGETLLVRREGEDVVYLNDLRFAPEAALELRVSLTHSELPAVKAALGQTGVVEGLDYRGVEVLASIAAVPGSPWFLVAKMDASEVYAPLRARLWQTLLFLGMLIFGGGAGLVVIWRQQQLRNFRTRLESHDTLAASEEKFRKAFLITPDAVAITRLTDGRFISVNDGFTNILGYTAEDVLGRSSLELDIWDNPQDRQKIVSALQEYGQVQNYEARFRTKQGEIRHGLMSAAVIELNGEAHILNTTRDVTESKQAAAQVKRSEEQYRLLFENNPVPMWIYDADSLRFLAVNEMAVLKYGYSRPEFLAMTIKNIRPAEDVPALLENLSSAEGAIQDTGPWRHCKKGGEVILVEIISHAIDYFGCPARLVMVNDVTARVQAEEALRDSEQRYHTLAEISPVGIFRTDMQGHTTYVNPRWSEISGLPAGQALGDGWLEAVHPEDRQPLAEGWKDVAQRHNPSQSEYRFVRPDGSVTWVMGQAVPELDSDGGFVGYVGTITDITERKQAEDALRESEQNYRLLFDEMLSGFAVHEIICDADGIPVDYRFLAINSAFEKLTGLKAADILGKTVKEALPGTEPVWIERYGQVALTREAIQFEDYFSLLEKHFEVRAFSPEPGKFAAIFNDITERKQAEQALRQKQAQLQSILDYSPALISIKDLQGNIVLANRSFAVLDAPPLNELIGRNVFDIFPHEIAEVLWQNDQAALRSDGPVYSEEVVRHKDGILHTYFTVKFPLYLETDQPVGTCAISNDITDRKQAEDDLMASEARYRHTLDDMLEGCQILGRDWVYLYLNAVAEKQNHRPKEELLGRKYADAWPGIRSTAVYEAIRKCLEEGMAQNLENEFRYLDGQVGWFDLKIYPVPEGTVILSIDITERKQAEEALKASEETFRSIVRSSPMGIHIYQLEENSRLVFTGYNPAADQLLDVDHSRYLGKTIEESFPPLQQTEIPERYRLAARDGTTWSTHQVEYHDGIISGAFDVTAFQMTPGKVAVLFNEVTARKKAEEQLALYTARLEELVDARTHELRQAQEKLVRQERLAVLGQLAGSVGHELRNPLGVISNAAYYLKLIQPAAEDKVKDYLQIIENETRIAEKIIADLLDFARIKNLDRQPVNVAVLLEQAFERYPLPSGVKLTRRVGRGLPLVLVDSRQITQVLGNLLENACQAMEGKGSLALKAKREKDMVTIAITDTGPGISPENLEKVFEPLFTTKARGIGLGLAVSQRFVEANGGRIEVRNEAKGGCTFTVWLPVVREGSTHE